MSKRGMAMFVSEAARTLGVTEQTVRDWADAGKLKVERTSNGTRILDRDDVEQKRRERKKADHEAA